MLKNNKILCSTGTIIGRRNDFDYTLIPEYSKTLKCDGFEFMAEPFWNDENKTDEIAACLIPYSINFETLHMDKNIGDLISRNEKGDINEALRIFTLNCALASKLGAKLLVLHLWGGYSSDKNIGFNIEIYAKLLKIAEKYNLLLTAESVVCNTYNPLVHMKKLYETYGGDMKFTVDVRHLEFHKILKAVCEADFLWENDLVPHFHIADYCGDCMDWSKLRPVLGPGEGEVDFVYFSDFLKKINYKGSFTLECESRAESGSDTDRVNKGLDFIYNLIF